MVKKKGKKYWEGGILILAQFLFLLRLNNDLSVRLTKQCDNADIDLQKTPTPFETEYQQRIYI